MSADGKALARAAARTLIDTDRELEIDACWHRGRLTLVGAKLTADFRQLTREQIEWQVHEAILDIDDAAGLISPD